MKVESEFLKTKSESIKKKNNSARWISVLVLFFIYFSYKIYSGKDSVIEAVLSLIYGVLGIGGLMLIMWVMWRLISGSWKLKPSKKFEKETEGENDEELKRYIIAEAGKLDKDFLVYFFTRIGIVIVIGIIIIFVVSKILMFLYPDSFILN